MYTNTFNEKMYCIAEFEYVNNTLKFVRYQTDHGCDTLTDATFYSTLENAEFVLKQLEKIFYSDYFKNVFKIIEVDCNMKILGLEEENSNVY